MEEAHGASWWSPRGLLRLFVCYYAAAFMWSLIVAQVRYRMYREHFEHLDNLEWLDYL